MSDLDTGGDYTRYVCKLCQVNEATDGELCESCAYATQEEEPSEDDSPDRAGDRSWGGMGMHKDETGHWSH